MASFGFEASSSPGIAVAMACVASATLPIPLSLPSERIAEFPHFYLDNLFFLTTLHILRDGHHPIAP